MTNWRSIRNWSREEMMKRVARFKKLKGSDGGLPDSPLPECKRKLFAVIGFQPPMSDNAATTSPVHSTSSDRVARDCRVIFSANRGALLSLTSPSGGAAMSTGVFSGLVSTSCTGTRRESKRDPR